MQRQRWFELHDQEWFPASMRDLVTEALEAMWNANRTYRCIIPLLRQAIDRSGTNRVVDLCSGGGGPWLSLYEDVSAGRPLEVCLTDLHPNAGVTVSAARRNNGFRTRPEPVDARCVPADVVGFRTIFSSFHHFDPESARSMLADAFRRRQGIAVFEAAQRSPRTMVALTGVPLLALKTAASIRPFRWIRLFWTWILPVIPAVLWVDGILSCLRSYSLDDLRELTEGLSAPDYRWHIGEQNGGTVAITYLIGTPQP